MSTPQVGSSQNPSSQTGTSLDVNFYLHVVRLWWYVAVPAGLLVGVAAAAAVWALSKPVYMARASVLISDGSSVIFRKAFSDDRDFAGEQKDVIKGRRVLREALLQDELAHMPGIVDQQRDPIDVLADKINVKAGGADVHFITCESTNRHDAQTIVNTVLDTYLKYTRKKENEYSNYLLTELAAEIELQETQIKKLQRTKTEIARELLEVDPLVGQTQLADSHPVHQLTQQIAQLEVDVKVLEGQMAAVKARKVQELAGDMPVQAPELESLDAKILALEQGIDDRTRRVISPEDSKLVADRKELAELKEQRKSREDDLREVMKGQYIAAAEQARDAELSKMAAELAPLQTRLSIARSQRESMIGELTGHTDKQVEYDLVGLELSQAVAVRNDLKDRSRQISIEMRSPRRVHDEKRAELPKFPIERAPIKLMVAAGGATFWLPFALCGLLEYRSRRLTNVAEFAKQHEALPVIGEVVSLPAGRRASSNRAMRVYEDSVDNLRTYISLRWDDAEKQVVAVCSASTGEGKTTIASQLAASIARTDGKTLLIDADTRMPDLHAVFGIDGNIGLVDVLKGTVDVETAVVHSSESLHVLPSGALTSNPHKLFQGQSFAELMAWARDHYEHVIIDTPPVLAAAEAMIISRQADRTIMCAMRDVSRVEQVMLSQRRLESAGAKVSGLVFSGVTKQQYSYRYGNYGYGY